MVGAGRETFGVQPVSFRLALRRLLWEIIWRPRWSLRFVKAQEKRLPTVALVEQGTVEPELAP